MAWGAAAQHDGAQVDAQAESQPAWAAADETPNNTVIKEVAKNLDMAILRGRNTDIEDKTDTTTRSSYGSASRELSATPRKTRAAKAREPSSQKPV